MEKFVRELFREYGIDAVGMISLADCHIQRGYLLERCGISEGTVFIFAVPYYTAPDGKTNLSAYAYPRDYHIFMKELAGSVKDRLCCRFPGEKFEVFADHSPLDERHAAAASGIGIYGRNGLLITEKYSSYVFLGEVVTSATLDVSPKEIRYCENCGRCVAACPYHMKDNCLSALTQKKGVLSPEEEETILKYGSVWGCDICTEVCPHTVRAKKNGTICSPIRFFNEDRITYLTLSDVENMSEEEFSGRAYAWRGRQVITRNLKLFENKGE